MEIYAFRSKKYDCFKCNGDIECVIHKIYDRYSNIRQSLDNLDKRSLFLLDYHFMPQSWYVFNL